MRKIVEWLIIFLKVLLVAYVIVTIGMYVFQRSFLYLPDKQAASPSDLGLSGVQSLIIPASDGEKLQAWFLPAKPDRPTILYLHGNAGSIAGRADRLTLYQQNGYGMLLLSYRGYGGSTGSPTEQGLVNDAVAAYTWLNNQNIQAEKIVLVGESLGAAIAVRLAVKHPVSAVILEAPFTSTMDVAKATYWWLPVNLLMKDRFETIKIIDQVKSPLLIVHGDQDEVTNVRQGKQLFASAPDPKTLKIIKGASHVGIQNQDVWRMELEFIARLFLK